MAVILETQNNNSCKKFYSSIPPTHENRLHFYERRVTLFSNYVVHRNRKAVTLLTVLDKKN